MFPWAYNTQASATKIISYSNNASTVALETVDVVVGTGGTALGTADGTTTNLNHTYRLRYGSNNWKESAIRQYLNSSAAAGSVWRPQTKFDRAPSWTATTAGFMSKLPDDFVGVVKPVALPTVTNSVYEVADQKNSSYVTSDRFWLPSRYQIFGTTEGATVSEEQFAYFVGAADVDRIKYDTTGAAWYWWLRSPNVGYTYDVRLVATSGVLSDGIAYYGCAVAPACVIY